MFKKTSPLVIITLVVGLMYGCGSTNPYVNDAESQLKENNPSEALTAAEQSIQNRPSDPLGYYYKAVALGSIAETKDAAQRLRDYEDMKKFFKMARSVADTAGGDKPKQFDNISIVITQTWAQEFNKSVDYINNDSVRATVDNPIKEAVAHLKNATTIQPDSANSWKALAQIAYMDDQNELAVKAMEKAISLLEAPSPEDYINLAAYYVNAGDREGTVEALERGQKAHPGNTNITQRLADAYQQAGKTEKAIETVRKLVNSDPQNPQYRLALGTQIYRTALKINGTIKSNYDKLYDLGQEREEASGAKADSLQKQIDKLEKESEQKQQEYNKLAEEAEKHLQVVIEQRPDDADAYNTLGVIYQNKAAVLFAERNETVDDEEAAKLDKKAKDALREAMKYYEKAAEIDPDNKSYWKSLFQVYTNLGMDEKADEAMEKAGMNN